MKDPFRTSEEMVKEFHQEFGHPIATTPGSIPDDRLRLRLLLIAEEVTELLCAMTGQSLRHSQRYQYRMRSMVREMFSNRSAANLVEVADGACDSHVVISGTCIEFGIPEDVVYEAVHASNMAKKGGATREDGKTLKPAGWQPPDIKGILYRALDGEL